MAGSIKSLSSYALRCGCVGKKRIGDTEVVIEHEGCCFQVHAYDYEEHQRVMWQGYKTVSAARKAFSLVVRGLRMYHKKSDRLVLSEEIESYV